MSERLPATDNRPPSQPSALLLMPAGDYGGLGLGDGSAGPSLLMPASGQNQSSSQLLAPDEESEVDSFVGQMPPFSSLSSSDHHHSTQMFTMFQNQVSSSLQHDPFHEIRQPQLEELNLSRQGQGQGQGPPPPPPSSLGQSAFSRMTVATPPGPAPLPQFSSVPFTVQTSNLPPPSALPPTIAAPSPATSTSANLFRMSGRPQYAAPPPLQSGVYQQQSAFLPNQLIQQQQQQSSVPLGGHYHHHQQQQMEPTSGVSVLRHGIPSAFEHQSSAFAETNNSSNQFLLSNVESMSNSSYEIHPPTGLPPSGITYHPVQHHWFRCVTIEGKDVWNPYSMIDSRRLEEAFASGASVGQLISVEGGRYDVNVRQRSQTAIYWREETTLVRRCSWFFRPDAENRFVPYDEEFSKEVEESYKRTILTNDFHKRLIFANGETIVIHNPDVIVQFSSSAQPDAYGNTASEKRPSVVKRGFEEFQNVPEDESLAVDHLVFIVQGISSTCNLRFRSCTECVDNFRSVSNEMIKSHFKEAKEQGTVRRIEFLPVIWNNALHGDVEGIDRKLKSITLSSVGKLRHFSNDSLIDLLFYRSPVYAQDIITTVGNELNRIVNLFKNRNSSFIGGISIVGHSLGSQILFDLLLNQSSSESEFPPTESKDVSAFSSSLKEELDKESNGKSVSGGGACEGGGGASSNTNEIETLDSVLSHLGLSNYTENFKKEQIDLNSLILCEENEIKEMGLPLGPRKKLLGFLKEYKDREAKRKIEAEEKAEKMALLKAQEEAKKLEEAKALETRDPLISSSNNTSVMYVVGKTGIGCPLIQFPSLSFQPENFFALGSPIAMYLAMKGIENLDEDFCLPTCSGFFNIFHPFDPSAYRLEPLVLSSYPSKPVLIPHHKGRKRLHLELKDSLTRIGYDLKQRIIDSVRSTWRSLNSFAMGHKTSASLPQDEVEREVENVLSEMTKEADDSSSVVASSVADEEDLPIGNINQGRRVDFVLQEKPIEIFNDYMFALGSYSCYWESEDTALMMLKEIYLLMGILPKKPLTDHGSSLTSLTSPPPPPSPLPQRSGFIQTMPVGTRVSNPLLQNSLVLPPLGTPPTALVPLQRMVQPPPPPLLPPQTMAPPPLSGFVKK